MSLLRSSGPAELVSYIPQMGGWGGKGNMSVYVQLENLPAGEALGWMLDFYPCSIVLTPETQN